MSMVSSTLPPPASVRLLGTCLLLAAAPGVQAAAAVVDPSPVDRTATSVSASVAAPPLASAKRAAMPQRVAFPHLPTPVGPYSHAVRHGSTLYMSGLTAAGIDAYGSDAGAQARAILGQIEEVLRQRQLGWESLIKVTVFVVGQENLVPVRAALTAAYGDNPPASSLVRVAGLVDPALTVEIEAVIGLPEAGFGQPPHQNP